MDPQKILVDLLGSLETLWTFYDSKGLLGPFGDLEEPFGDSCRPSGTLGNPLYLLVLKKTSWTFWVPLGTLLSLWKFVWTFWTF